jgi:DNA-binding response OmpR family regulator
LQSHFSENPDLKQSFLKESEKLFEKLFVYEKKKALKYSSSFKSYRLDITENMLDITENKDKYFVKLREKEYNANFDEVQRLKEQRDIFDLYVDVNSGIVFVKDKGFIDFSRKRFLAFLLFHFVKNSGKSYSKEELYVNVWKAKFNKFNDAITIKTSISRLRKLIEPEPEKPLYIKIYSSPYKNESRYYFPESINFCFIEKL